jgi:hypothetical protein
MDEWFKPLRKRAPQHSMTTYVDASARRVGSVIVVGSKSSSIVVV